MNIAVYYHKDCSDGFGAAYAAWKSMSKDATYHPLTYGAPIDVEGVDLLYFLDVVPQPFDQIHDIARQVGQIVIIDHHRTAMEAAANTKMPSNVRAKFDMGNSASVLAWKHFHPSKDIPALLLYVQDRDLWQKQLYRSDDVAAAIRSYPFEFELWDGWTRDSIFSLADIGAHVNRAEKTNYRRAMEHVQYIQVAGQMVPFINTTVGGSDAANEMLGNLKVPVAGFYYDGVDKRHWSLRSDGTVDVGEMAKRYGGGGHTRAAGFNTLLAEYHL